MAERKKVVKQRRREKKNVPQGHVHIQATFNNTIITITDLNGAVISWGSAGVAGFKGSRKSTPYAAALSADGAAKRAMEHGMRQVEVYVKGPGAGREQAIRSLQTAGLEVSAITDLNGAVISWGSAGVAGFKGSRKSTPYAAALSADGAAKRAMEHGMRQVEVYVKGPGAGREQAIRSLQAAGLEVSAITDVTPIPHNGCRPPKRRRV